MTVRGSGAADSVAAAPTMIDTMLRDVQRQSSTQIKFAIFVAVLAAVVYFAFRAIPGSIRPTLQPAPVSTSTTPVLP